MGVELQGVESCFKLSDLFWCHTEYIIISSFAIPVHKTCEDSCDKGVQFVLKAVPHHQTSNDAYFFVLKRSLDFVTKELKSGKS